METQVLRLNVSNSVTPTSRESINSIKTNFFSTCPLIGLRAATMNALSNTCNARRKINDRALKIKQSAVKMQHQVDFVPTAQSFIYPACFDCDMYKEIIAGKIPDALKHIKIIEV